MILNKLVSSVLNSQRGFLNISKNVLNASIARTYVTKEFENAQNRVLNLQNNPPNDVKLKLYALFKQATVGPCNTPKPGMMDFVNRAKWTAWSDLKISKEEAEKQYIDLVNQLAKSEEHSEADHNSARSGKYENILTSIEHGHIFKITFNRPTKYNAINIKMYNEIIEALKEADSNPKITICCFTGAGEYYCSGNDLSSFTTPEVANNVTKAAKEGGVLLKDFVNAFINFSKPLVAVVNGPAVGISVTLLGLFDLVIASDKATFVSPFTRIAQSPEACSSYTFPRMMGRVKASEFLMFNRKLTAQEAYERNLVSHVIPHGEFSTKAWEIIEDLSKLPPESLLESRKILRDGEKETLRQVNQKEVDVLVGRWSSSEFMNVIVQFWNNKSKK